MGKTVWVKTGTISDQHALFVIGGAETSKHLFTSFNPPFAPRTGPYVTSFNRFVLHGSTHHF